VLATLGKREVYERGGNRDLSSFERVRVRWQALGVVARAAMIAALAAAIAWVV
jgi:ABC-type xylose transport system permease subunit